MKNLFHNEEDIEKLENLPIRSRIPLGNDGWGRYKGRDYPYNKVHRFLESMVGVDWNQVFSKFCHLTWIKDEDKTREKIGWDVVFDTLMVNDSVHYLEEGSGIPKPIANYRYGRGTFYVHPITQKLCYQPKKKDKKEKNNETFRVLGNYHQLVKVKGIWHEVKGVPVESDIVTVDGLHYRKVKTLPEEKQEARTIYPPLPQKFFGRKVIDDKLPYKKTDDGYYLIPINQGNYRHGYGYYTIRDERIGPKDRMIAPDKSDNEGHYYYNRKLHNSVKITMNKQLSSKELKKYGVKNDIVNIGKPCKECGNVNCTQPHDNRCNICGEKWCRIHAIKPHPYAVGSGNPKI